MSVAFIVLSRGMTLTKEQWRHPGLRRTLERLEATPVVEALYRGLALGDGPVVCAAELNGVAKLTLREEACSRRYGTPEPPARRADMLTVNLQAGLS